MAQETSRFARSVRPHAKRKLKILVLHSFRQSASRLRSRMRAIEAELEDIAELEFVEAPHPYEPDAEESTLLTEDFGDVPDFRHQRCWWNADAEGSYQGCEDSLRSVAAHFPVDGILGFSQGAALTGLLAALHAEQLRFAICISGFPARSEAHAAFMAPQGIDLPSLHIYGEQDVLMDHERTLALAGCFVEPQIVSHEGGHFFPDLWPRDVLRSFLLPFLAEPPTTPQLDVAALDAITTLDAARQAVAASADRAGLIAEAARWRPAAVPHAAWWREPIVPQLASPSPNDAGVLLRLAAYEREPALVLDAIANGDDFAGFVRLAVLAVREGADAEPLLSAIAQRFADQIVRDEGLDVVSGAGRAAPRPRSQVDRITGLGKRIAAVLAPETPSDVGTGRYRRRVAELSRRLRGHERRRMRRLEPGAPSKAVSVEITRPRPVPVVAAPLGELQPLLQYLQGGQEVLRPVAFPRGTLMPDGRLDLCKQVVGPQGIGPLLGAMEDSVVVRRLLLGNNVVGRRGADQIAGFIRSGRSGVRVWYIAGNEIDAEGLAPICDALIDASTPVEGLWLKRNPLGPASGPHLARLLRADTALVTLDLVNTGLLDEGARPVVKALADNSSLRHLYLGTDGLTAELMPELGAYLALDRGLHSLFVDCNRIGDAGVEALAAGLAQNRTLKRLSLASNRIGPVGVAALVEALRGHPSLVSLNLGWTRATAAVQEGGNQLGDAGAATLAELLKAPSALRVLDVSHNGITQRGLNALCDALEGNSTLVGLRCPQRGKATNPDRIARLRGFLYRNRQMAGLDLAAVDAFRTPRPAHEVLSVYRMGDGPKTGGSDD